MFNYSNMILENLYLCGLKYTYCIPENYKRFIYYGDDRGEKLTLYSSKYFCIRNGYTEELYYPSQLYLECVGYFNIGERGWVELPIQDYHGIHLYDTEFTDFTDVEINVNIKDFDPSKLTIKYGYVCMGEPNYNYEVGVIVSIEYDGISIYNAQKTPTL